MQIKTDHRSIEVHPAWDDELVLGEVTGAYRDLQVVVAQALDRIRWGRHHAMSGCSSIEQYARRFGFGPHEARALARLDGSHESPLRAAAIDALRSLEAQREDASGNESAHEGAPEKDESS